MLNSFLYLVNQGFKNLWNNRLMSLASIGVLVSCMLLIGAAALLSVNVSSIVDAVEDQSEAIVYLEDGLDDAAVEEVRDGLIATGKVATIEFFSKPTQRKTIFPILSALLLTMFPILKTLLCI